MNTLEHLGWDADWAAKFAPHQAAGCFAGRVCVEHRELYHYFAEHGEGAAPVSGRLRHEALGRADFPAVGDWVALKQAGPQETPVIQAVLPRVNKFSRGRPDNDGHEQIIAANLDTLFLVTSLNRDLNPRRLERYLAAASAWRVRPVLLLNKSDLCDQPQDAAAELARLIPGVAVHAVSAHTGVGLDALADYVRVGQTVATVGMSGVGKSTLLNRLLGQDYLAVQEIRVADARGRHTTTHREMVRLPQGGLLIDNPGTRELRLWDEGTDLDGTFADVADFAARCKFSDCGHEHEPGCAVRAAVEDGRLSRGRLESFRKLQREVAYQASLEDEGVRRERKAYEKRIHRIVEKELRRKGRK